MLAVSKQAANNMYRNHSRNPSPLPIVNIVPTQEVIRAKSVTPPPPTCEYMYYIYIFFFYDFLFQTFLFLHSLSFKDILTVFSFIKKKINHLLKYFPN